MAWYFIYTVFVYAYSNCFIVKCQFNVKINGKVSYFKHAVIPEQNIGKECYIYCINTFK